MKKTILLLSLAAMLCTSATAQTKEFSRGIFNRIGVNAGVGTEGIHLSVASPCTNLLEFSIPGLSTLMAQLGMNVTISTTSGRWTTPLPVITTLPLSRPSTIPAPQVSTCPPLTPSPVSRRMVRIMEQ